MKLTIDTAFKNVEVANYILNMAISEIENSTLKRDNLDLSETDVKYAKRFLKASCKALVNQVKIERIV